MPPPPEPQPRLVPKGPGIELPEPEHEARQAKRRSMSVPALIGIPGYRLTIPCRILDMSATGFGTVLIADPKRRIREAHDLPDKLTLIVLHERTEMDCRIRWRAGARFGAQFTSRPRRRIARSV